MDDTMSGIKAETALNRDDDDKKRGELDVKKLVELFGECLLRPQSFYNNQAVNRDARFNYWPGKSFDGRKWQAAQNDSEILPWKGASDLSVPMVDGYVNEDAALSTLAIMRGNISASAVRSQSTAAGKHATNIIKWMLFNEMTEFRREVSLQANYYFERGRAVLGCMWDRQTQMSYEELTLEMIQGMAQGAQQALMQIQAQQQQGQQMALPEGSPSSQPSPPGEGEANEAATQDGQAPESPDQLTQMQEIASLPQMIMDPQYEDRIVELLQSYAKMIVQKNFAEALGEYGDELLEDFELAKKTARRLARELREEGRTKIPVPGIQRNRPVFMALALDEDFFFPNDATDLENARALFWREWITEEQLRERVVSKEWDADWVEYVAKHGKGTVGPNAQPAGAASGSYTGGAQSHGKTLLETKNLYGILHCFEKRSNEDGVPGIYYTVIHPGIQELLKKSPVNAKVPDHAFTELLNYAHGEYPFTLFRREHLSRRIDDSRGYGEVAFPWQRVVKTELDMRTDRNTLATNPPLHHPKGRPPAKWGPGVKVPGQKSDYQYAEIPQWDPGSENNSKDVYVMADRYFGRQHEGMDPVRMQVLQQSTVDNWLSCWALAITQMWQLMQQFLPDQISYRMIGDAKGQTIHTTRAEIQGKFDISVKFDTEMLDDQKRQQKTAGIIDLVEKLDTEGVTDHSALLALMLGWIDPDVPETILKPAENATAQEVEDEKTVFARMWAGVGTDVKPGQAYQLRLQVLQDCIGGKDPATGAPKNPAAMQRYQQDEQFKNLVDARMQQLNFQVEQRQNAVIGRLGGKPAGS
jgi:hypothetical protein